MNRGSEVTEKTRDRGVFGKTGLREIELGEETRRPRLHLHFQRRGVFNSSTGSQKLGDFQQLAGVAEISTIILHRRRRG